MPSLADIYSTIDSYKRKLGDVVGNPIGSLQQAYGNANDQAGQLNDLTYQAALESTKYGPASQQLGEQIASSYNPIGMTTWHGSPHVFEKFDLSKLGTGEGAQAYGSGMYVAENPSVAKGYQENIAKGQFQTPAGEVFDTRASIKNPNIRAVFEKTNGDIDAAIERGKKVLQSIPNTQGAEFAKSDIPVLEQLKTIGGVKRPEGNLYKVDLPDTHIRRMLDWDAPIKEQAAVVRNLAQKLGLDKNDLGGDLLAQVGKDEAGRKILQDAGIRGVKYLDEQSRYSPHQVDLSIRGKPYASNQFVNKDQALKYAEEKKSEGFEANYKPIGTRNFVVFDPKHLKILERNNQPIQ
jgi:hypothetical protein